MGGGAFGVGVVQHHADEGGEEAEADVLNPEDGGIGRADDLLVDQLGHRGPQGGGHQREGGAEDEDGDIGHHGAADGVALEDGQDEGEGEVADDQQDGAEHEHGGSLTLVVDIVAEDGGDGHGQQREHGEDGLGGATHVAHVAVDDEGHDGEGHEAELQAFLLREVAGEGADGHDEHDDVLHDGHLAAGPEGTLLGGVERQVALQHVDGIFLEGEDGAVVEHAEQSHEPETEAGEDLA